MLSIDPGLATLPTYSQKNASFTRPGETQICFWRVLLRIRRRYQLKRHPTNLGTKQVVTCTATYRYRTLRLSVTYRSEKTLQMPVSDQWTHEDTQSRRR